MNSSHWAPLTPPRDHSQLLTAQPRFINCLRAPAPRLMTRLARTIKRETKSGLLLLVCNSWLGHSQTCLTRNASVLSCPDQVLSCENVRHPGPGIAHHQWDTSSNEWRGKKMFYVLRVGWMKFNQLDNALTFCFCRKCYLLLVTLIRFFFLLTKPLTTFLLSEKVIDDILFYR